MIECLILGDSIATGIAQHRPECVSYAKVGINSKSYNRLYDVRSLETDTVIISLGTNDHPGIDTYAELMKLRSSLNAKRVIWIMPANVNVMYQAYDIQRKIASKPFLSIVRASVESVAGAYGDAILTIPRPMADRYHPTGRGYQQLAKRTR